MASTSEQPLRLLSLDGGGVKGLTSLLILERIFEAIKNESGCTTVPKPCEYFDLIGGTSTGGLIAIMLGRLKMSVSECLSVYKSLSEKVFCSNWRQGFGMKMLNAGMGNAWFKGEDLERAVKGLLLEHGLPEDTPMREATDPDCKVFVCVTRTHNSQSDLLRSYQIRDSSQRNYECLLWEAARATTAAPMFFDKISLKTSGATFVDGAMRLNNPIYELIREAERVYPHNDIGCIVSIGTGWVSPASLDNAKLLHIVAACAKIALDAQGKADEFLHDSRGTELWKAKKHFRFNVEQGMQDVKLDEWNEVERMDAMTTAYLSRKDKADEVQSCARCLLDPSPLTVKYKAISVMPRDPNPNFTGRLDILKEIEDIYKRSSPLHKRVVLWGLGGVGKSQIALKYAEIHQRRFAVFWVRADSGANILEDFERISQTLRPNERQPSQAVDMLSRVLGLLEDKAGVPWLLILDGADDKDIFISQQGVIPPLSNFIPRATHGRILITSRDSRISGLADGLVVPTQNGIKVDSMTEAEGVELLKRSIPSDLYDRSNDSETGNFRRLVTLLGALPLALSQAAAFIRYDRVPVDDFFDMYQGVKDHSDMFRYPAYSQEKEKQSVLLTWELSYKRIGGRAPPETKSPSAKLLDIMGFFHSQSIPKASLQSIYKKESLNGESFYSAIGRLLNFCLVYQNPRSDEYWIHPVVHEWIYRRLGSGERCYAIDVVVREFHEAFPVLLKAESITKLRSNCRSLFPHVITVVDFASENSFSSQPLGELCSSCGILARYYGLLDVSVRLLRASVDEAESQGLHTLIVERRLLLTRSLCDSADAISAQAEVSACVDLAEENKIEDVKQLVAESLRLQGRFTEANVIEEELLALRIKRYGEISEPVARTKHAISYNLTEAQKLGQIAPSTLDYAITLSDESIAIYQQLGLTATTNFLAFLSKRAALESDTTTQEDLVKRLLDTSIHLFGYGNIETVQFAIQRIAGLSQRDDWAGIEKLCKEFLEHEPADVQGKAQIKWANVKGMLGTSLQRQGRPAEAEVYAKQHLESWKRHVGSSTMVNQETFDIATYNLALCLARQGKNEEEAAIRDEFLESVERAESLYGRIPDRLKDDKEREQNLALDSSAATGLDPVIGNKASKQSKLARLTLRLKGKKG